MALRVWLDVKTCQKEAALLEINAGVLARQLWKRGIHRDEERGGNSKNSGGETDGDGEEDAETHMSKVAGWSNVLWLE